MNTTDNLPKWRLSSILKGMPDVDIAFDALADGGWNILREDFPTPVAVLRASALERNRRWMTAFRQAVGVDLCPHGKTTMSPELFRAQIDDGAWGLTCATVSHLEVYYAAGVRRIIFANQLLGRANLNMALRHLRDPRCEILFVVDSVAGVEAIAQTATALGLTRKVSLLIEVGALGGRTGVRRADEALALGRHIAGCAAVTLRGVETFEGIYGRMPESEALVAVDRLLDLAADVASELDRADLFDKDAEVVLSAGGSDFFDRVVERFTQLALRSHKRIILRSGCYIAHDDLHYTRAFKRLQQRNPSLASVDGGLEPALEVWAHVQSAPEPGRLYCSIGKRDISYDWDLPVPRRWSRFDGGKGRPQPLSADHQTIALNDQHLFLSAPADTPLRIGDMIGFGISHPCTTFDKWRTIPLVDDDYNVVGAIRTFF